MESPGTYIKREREYRGISLEKMHESTRVPLKNLKALEQDRFDLLPAPAFIRGYIKAICKCLGLDETDTLLRYEMYVRETSLQVMPARDEELPQEKRPFSLNSKNIVTVLVVIGVIIIIAFYFVISGKSRFEPLRGDKAPTAPQTDSAEKVEEAPPGPADLSPPQEAKPAEVKSAPQGPGHVLKVKALEDVWIKTTLDGGEPFEVLLKEGEEVEWTASENFSLVIGNAAGVSLTFDGREFPLLGEHGKVVRLSLPPEGAIDKGEGSKD
ncbi:MAG: hypothetical protein BMS9Abin23_0125 [Thermodesulfobacteriota bacterium]|nr:MAG: hypothetical protein BMS9Abin23_0125 [Thermodesulfobacteriota bacterium]